MRIELAIDTACPRPLVSRRTRGRARLDRVEVGLLLAFALVSCWVLGLDLFQVIANGHVWTGTDGFFITDQMQYLAWIRSASHHFLVSDMFVLHGTRADYFQPAIQLSAGLTALGVTPWLTLMLWKPVAVLVTFFAIRAYANRSLSLRWQRHLALTLGLFFGCFTVIAGEVTVIGDMFPGFLSWGYPFGLIALGVMIYGLIHYDRAREGDRLSLVPAALGALASSLHPWQGETLILIVLAAELLALRGGRPDRRRLALAIVTLGGTALPLLYYLLLGKFDPAWGLARMASKHTFPFLSVLLALLPLLPFAALAYRRAERRFWSTTTLVWPLVSLLVYVFSASGASATPLHAFQGITIPLGVLAAQGLTRTRWRQLRHRRVVAIVALALVCIPASAYEMYIAPAFMNPGVGNANFITHDESAALRYLSHSPRRGGVLTGLYLGSLVPARTGRNSYNGDCLWSQPNCDQRNSQTTQLLAGQLDASQAQSLVAGSRARFVLADCNTSAGLGWLLGPLVSGVHRFGCAGVYEIRAPTVNTAA